MELTINIDPYLLLAACVLICAVVVYSKAVKRKLVDRVMETIEKAVSAWEGRK